MKQFFNTIPLLILLFISCSCSKEEENNGQLRLGSYSFNQSLSSVLEKYDSILYSNFDSHRVTVLHGVTVLVIQSDSVYFLTSEIGKTRLLTYEPTIITITKNSNRPLLILAGGGLIKQSDSANYYSVLDSRYVQDDVDGIPASYHPPEWKVRIIEGNHSIEIIDSLEKYEEFSELLSKYRKVPVRK